MNVRVATRRPVSVFRCCLILMIGLGSWGGNRVAGQCTVEAWGADLAQSQYSNACDAVRPRWYLTGAVLAMDRITEDPLTLIVNPTSTAEQVNRQDFDYEWELGIDLSLFRQRWDDSGFEVRYLDLGRFDAVTRTPVSNAQVRIEAAPPIFVAGVQTIDTRASSELWGFETNYHYPLYRYADIVVGFRYLDFDDRIDSVIDATPQTVRTQIATTNQMYGGQVGLISKPFDPMLGCVFLSGFAKAGIFGNDGRHDGLVDTGVSRLAIRESADDSSFLGEFGLTASIPICERARVFASYRLVWLESVAVASEQLAISDYFDGRGSTTHGSVVFHGAALGVEWLF